MSSGYNTLGTTVRLTADANSQSLSQRLVIVSVTALEFENALLGGRVLEGERGMVCIAGDEATCRSAESPLAGIGGA